MSDKTQSSFCSYSREGEIEAMRRYIKDTDKLLAELRAALAAQAEELRIAHDAIEAAYDACQNLPDDDDGDAAVKRCTLRRLNEAVGKAMPRLVMERPGGQRLYGLRWKELNEELAALRAERDALQSKVAEIIGAWKSLPGGKYYSPSEIADWLAGSMKRAIDAARGSAANKEKL